MSNKTLVHLDSSILKNLKCFRYYYRRAILGKSLSTRSNYKQAFGTAIHKFLQSFYQGVPFNDCLKQAKDYYTEYQDDVPVDNVFEFRYMTHLQKTCLGFAELHRRTLVDEKWKIQGDDFVPFKSDGKETLETKFSIPVFENEKYILFLSGTIDMLAEYGGHKLVVVDHKTTSTTKPANFMEDFDFSIQTMLYSLVTRKLNNLPFYPPVAVNCFFLKKPTIKADKEGRFDGCNYIVSPIFEYSDNKMERFENWLNKKIALVVRHLETDCKDAEEDYDYVGCAGDYGYPCEFRNICRSETSDHKAMLDNNYKDHPYNPLKFQD